MLSKLFPKIAGLVLAVAVFTGGTMLFSSSWAEGDEATDADATDGTYNQDAEGALPGDTDEDQTPTGSEEQTPVEPEYLPPVLVGADGTHAGYINGCGDGGFHPSEGLTRAQAAVMLFRLIESPGEERVTYSDVPEGSWYSDAAGYLGALGVLETADGQLRPGESVTRGEFAAMIDYLMLGHELEEADMPFPDVPQDHRYAAEIACAALHGWILGNTAGEFAPDNTVTRAEAVTVINRVLGAVPDREYMKNMYFSPFSDLFATHWAYYDVMEASVSHTHQNTGESRWATADTSALEKPEGIYFIGLDYCYVLSDGSVVRDGYVGSRYFGADGLFTSRSAELDGYVKDVIASTVDPGMTEMEKLRAVYNYTRDSFTYLRRNYHDVGDVSWANDEALTMFTTKRGNCYCYAAVFYSLARQLGFDPVLISGKVNNSNPIPHAWVEMEEDGKMYMYDAELEMAHRKKNDIRDLFRVDVNKTPWRYWR